MKIKSLLIFLFLSASFHTAGQSIVTGLVRENGTLTPLPFVNVYLASTSFGTTTAQNGEFSFKVNQRGKYDFVCSYVGYGTFRIPLIINSDSTFTFIIALEPKNFELRSVVVLADTTNRKRDFKEFKRIFLGETENALSCTIKNPDDIYVYFDKSENTLVAYARGPIIVENRALGHVLYYDLEKFEAKSNMVYIWGSTRFEDLSIEKESNRERWANKKEETYQGSLVHFMRSLISNRLQEEGWRVIIVYPKIRPPDVIIKQKITHCKDLDLRDSLIYYQYLKSLPPNSQLISMPLHGKELLSKKDDHQIDFMGTLSVTFKNETITVSSAPTRGSIPRFAHLYQNSEIYFLNKPLTIYDNGYYEPQQRIEISGHLSKGRASDFMPYNYKPRGKP